MVFRTVHVGVRVLVVSVRRVLGVIVLVLVMLGRTDRVVVTVTMRMDMRMLMSFMLGVIRMVVLMFGVLGAGSSHRWAPRGCGGVGDRLSTTSCYVCNYIRMHADSGTTVDGRLSRDAVDDDQVLMAVEMFRMLADATRVRILRALSEGAVELSVNDLSVAVGKRPGAVSQHLAKLRMARLVTTRRDGNQILYRAANEHVSQLVADALRHGEHLGPGIPLHHAAPS